ncbi:hypothetical protein LguiB_032506 [Lonicera macranthoides]
MNLNEEESILEEWVYQCFEDGELSNLVGDEVVDKQKLDRMVKVGLWCIHDEPSIRPSMKKAVASHLTRLDGSPLLQGRDRA